MNKAYRLILNKSTGIWMAVSEIARSRGKDSLRMSKIAAASLALSGGALFAPGEAEAAYYFNDGTDTGCSAIADTGSTSTAFSIQNSNNNCTITTTNPGSNIVFYNNSSANIGGDLTVWGNVTFNANKLALGSGASATGLKDMAFGASAVADSANAPGATATDYGVAMGNEAKAYGSSATALGAGATAGTNALRTQATRATAIGAGASAQAQGGTAIGYQATASSANAVALGASSTANRGAITSAANPLAYGTSTVTTTVGEVSVGSSTAQRQITNVAAGTQDTDVVNVAQVKAVKSVADSNAATTAAALGGGSTVNSSTGLISAPSYKLDSNRTTATNVGDALSNLDTRTTANTTSVNALTNGTAGLVKQANNTSTITVAATSAGSTVSFMGASADGASRVTRRLTGLSDGTVSETSSDAINGAQLHNVSSSVASALGGSASVNDDGTVKAPAYTVGGSTYNNVGDALQGLNTLATNSVQYDSTDKASVTLNNGGAAVRIKNVAAGTADTDAANVAQVNAAKAAASATANGIATALGGGAAVDANGNVTQPTYTLNGGNTTANTVGDALTNIDGRTTANTSSITDLSSKITNGAVGLVQQDAQSGNITVAKSTAGTEVGFAGTDASGNAITRKLTGLSDGTLSDTSTEAVTGKQLNATNTRVTTTESSISNLSSQINAGTVGLVQQDATTKNLTVAKDTAGTEVSFAGKDADGNTTTRKLTNVSAGTADTDAANVQQIKDVKAIADTNTSDITNLKNGTVGLVQQDATTQNLTVAKDTAGTEVSFAGKDTSGNAITRKLTSVSAGTADTDAANVAQLNAVKSAADTNTKAVADALGGGATVGTDGKLAGPTYKFSDTKSFNNVGDALGDLNTRTTANTTDIASVNTKITNLNNGATGLVQQDASTQNLTVAKDTAGTEVSFAGKDASGNATTRKLTNVTAGENETDAANYGQVKGVQANVDAVKTDLTAANMLNAANATATADALGTTVGADGKLVAPSYSADGKTFSNVKDVVSNLDGRVTTNTTDIATNKSDIANLSTQINSGSVGLVQQDAQSGNITVAKDTAGTEVSFAGQDASGNATTRKLTNVSAGEADTDAANVKQVTAVDQRVTNLDNVAVKYDANGNVDVARNGQAAQIKNVADGTEDSDAVNLRQLKQSGMINADGSVASVVTYDDADKKKATLAGGTDGTVLANVANGSVASGSKEAVNGGQLFAAYDNMASALGGGAAISVSGVWTAPSYTVGGVTYNNVGGALGNLDGRVATLEQGQVKAGGMFAGSGDTVAGTKQEASATGSYATASGANSVASGTNATAMGANAVASADNSVAIGAGSVANQADSVSVGSVGQERAITNVMAGTNATDAVNVQQLNDVKTQAAKTQQSVDTLQSQVNQRFDQVDNRMNRLGAMNAAMSTMVASAAGLQSNNRMAIGTGLYRGQTALAIGYQRKVNPRLTVTVGGSTAGGSEYNVGAGVGYGW